MSVGLRLAWLSCLRGSQTQLVRSVLAQHRKKLDESAFSNEMRVLVSKQDAGHPIYLRLACSELRALGVFERLGELLRDMASSLAGLLAQALARLEREYGGLVRKALAYVDRKKCDLCGGRTKALLRQIARAQLVFHCG